MDIMTLVTKGLEEAGYKPEGATIIMDDDVTHVDLSQEKPENKEDMN